MTQRSADAVGVKNGIVMPSFNQSRFIEAAIQSVLANAKNADIRFVVMDGGSTDGSVEIIRKYEAELAYWQSAPDGGQSAAINAGMRYVSECDYRSIVLHATIIYTIKWIFSALLCKSM